MGGEILPLKEEAPLKRHPASAPDKQRTAVPRTSIRDQTSTELDPCELPLTQGGKPLVSLSPDSSLRGLGYESGLPKSSASSTSSVLSKGYECRPSIASQTIIRRNNSLGSQMRVESIDLFRGYLGGRRDISLAVRVVTGGTEPVIRAEVSLIVISPDGRLSRFSESTDDNGIASFRVSDAYPGEWGVVVTEVIHPSYTFSRPASVDVSRAIFL